MGTVVVAAVLVCVVGLILKGMHKDKKNGCRITKQRLILLDIILEGNCNSCKEIYYKAAKKDSSIGTATVYRMINTLEDIGVISRRSIYEIAVDDKPLIKK